MQNRPSFHSIAIQIAHDISQRSTCPRLHTAAVICTPDNRIIASGYNGSLPGQPHCDGSDGLGASCEMVDGHCIRTVHAEANALMQAAKYGIAVQDCTMYVLHRPCVQCGKLIVSAGIKNLYWYHHYHDPNADSMWQKLEAAGLNLGVIPYADVPLATGSVFHPPAQTPVDS